MDVDLAVVGAGPSGLLCAWKLAKAGKKVAVFEKKLAPGGGIWGGGMLFNEVVIQEEARRFVKDLDVNFQDIENGAVRVDSVEFASSLIYHAIHEGVRVFNGVVVEDAVFKNDRISGLVINYSPVMQCNLHVDPLMVMSRTVLDGGGHHAEFTAKIAKKSGIKLHTKTGELMGEKPVWAELGEKGTVENTRCVYPGLYVSGMAANGVYGSFRMGPIFGGMLLSGEKAADMIRKELDE